jgi:hypothetical protein
LHSRKGVTSLGEAKLGDASRTGYRPPQGCTPYREWLCSFFLLCWGGAIAPRRAGGAWRLSLPPSTGHFARPPPRSPPHYSFVHSRTGFRPPLFVRSIEIFDLRDAMGRANATFASCPKRRARRVEQKSPNRLLRVERFP